MVTAMIMKNDPVRAKEFFEDKISFTTGPVELDSQIKQNADLNIVDVRAEEDFQAGHIPGAINIPKQRWRSPQGLSRERVNVLYCYTQTCHLAAKAAVEFAEQGFSVMEMEGGFKAWKENNFRIEQ